MKSEIDWRHIVAAVLVVGVIVFGGWKMLTAKPELPNAQAPSGPNVRMEDAPEHPPQGGAPAPGDASPKGVPAGFPTAQ